MEPSSGKRLDTLVRAWTGLPGRARGAAQRGHRRQRADVWLCPRRLRITPLGTEVAEQGQTGDDAALLEVGETVAQKEMRDGSSKRNVLPRLGTQAHR